jgi:hypothetical protein
VRRLYALAFVFVGGAAIAAPEAPPPWHLPSFDGASASDAIPAEPLERPARPDAQALFDMAISCYPSPSWFRPELSIQANYAERHRENKTNEIVNLDTAGTYAAVVFKMPLYSAADIERERERETRRRETVAAAVADFETALVDRANAQRELALLRAIEARSGKRVAAGVAETAEQVAALKEVAALESRLGKARAGISRARLTLIGMCKDREDIEAYLDRWAK